jgi:predicted ATPase/class 3 adenylate cyclase/Tfp pilus assembly protein PilF
VTASSPLPAETVTLVFTDIEKSTRILQALGEAYEGVLMEHQDLVRAALARHGGHEVGTAGDSFFIAFGRAHEAVAFAVDVQHVILNHPWPDRASVRIRIGMHTGTPALVHGQYVGLDVHRAARISSAGHGGQIILSDATRELVDADLPDGVTLRDLGMHRLKDLQAWEHIYQVLQADLPAVFPPLQSLDTLPNNLPRKLTTFIGREREITEVKRALESSTLLTIVGTGGAGKTRLALQVAADMLAHCLHGAWVVELAPVSDPTQIPQAAAAALGIREYPGLTLRDSLFEYLGSRELLLLLDNCEHLVAGVSEFVVAVIQSAPRIKILCTSRERLGIPGERIWRIPSLALPALGRRRDVSVLSENEAVRLFVDRARAVLPGFELTDAAARTVARICVRLDGLPLAIELAAARVRVLSVEQIAARLDDRFRLLAGASRTALPHQQTLQAAMDWGYDLLADPERALLRRLSVFAGGWTLEAAESICEDPDAGEPVLDLLARLVDKSLVEVEGATTSRYRMLETVRQYGWEKLRAAGEAAQFRSRHREWFLALSETAARFLQGPQQKTWLDRLDDERDNFRAALDWALEDRPEQALALTAALWRWSYLRGYLSIGAALTERALAAVPAATPVRVEALNGAAVLTNAIGKYARAEELANETITLARTFGDSRGAASGRLVLATAALGQGDFVRAGALAEQALAGFRSAGDRWGQALALSVLGDQALNRGEYERAVQCYDDSVAIFHEVGDAWGIAHSQRGSGYAARLQGDYDLAVSLQAASLAQARELGDRTGIGYSLVQLGFLQWRQGDYERAAAVLEESLAVFREAGNQRGVADALSVIALVEEYQGHHERAEAVATESLAMYRSLGSRFGVASITGTIGRVALRQGDARRARALAEESVALFRELGDRRGTASSLRLMGEALVHLGEYDRAARAAEESLALFREIGDRWAIGYALRLIAGIAVARKQFAAAHAWYAETFAMHRSQGDRLGIIKSLEGLADVMAGIAQFERGARMLGAAARLRSEIGAPRTPQEIASVDVCSRRLHEALGAAPCQALMAEGAAMDLDAILQQIAAPLGRKDSPSDEEPFR